MTKLTTIDFHGAKLIAVPGDKPETTLVAMKPIVEGMGLDWTYQFRKISGHPVLSTCVAVIAIQMPDDDQSREHTFLSLEMMNFWLATIHPDRIKDQAVRAKVIEYQTECARVLFNHFFGKALAAGSHLSAKEHGGITKSVVHKELSETERRLICEARNIMDDMARAFQSRLDALTLSVMGVTDSYDPTAGFTTEYRPMLAYVKNRAVPSKGRRNIVVSASRHCRAWLRRHGRSSMVRISRESNRHLFHVDGVEMWLRAEGDALIRSHLDHVLGQSALHLPPRHPKPSRIGKVIARSQKKKTELQPA